MAKWLFSRENVHEFLHLGWQPKENWDGRKAKETDKKNLQTDKINGMQA